MIERNKSLIGVTFLSIFLFFASGSIELSACPSENPLDCGGNWCCPDEGFENCEEMIKAGWCIQEACIAEIIYGDSSEEVALLRYFRNNILDQISRGQEIIRLYYEWSPAIVKAMEEDEEFKEEVKEIIDGILPLIEKSVK